MQSFVWAVVLLLTWSAHASKDEVKWSSCLGSALPTPKGREQGKFVRDVAKACHPDKCKDPRCLCCFLAVTKDDDIKQHVAYNACQACARGGVGEPKSESLDPECNLDWLYAEWLKRQKPSSAWGWFRWLVWDFDPNVNTGPYCRHDTKSGKYFWQELARPQWIRLVIAAPLLEEPIKRIGARFWTHFPATFGLVEGFMAGKPLSHMLMHKYWGETPFATGLLLHATHNVLAVAYEASERYVDKDLELAVMCYAFLETACMFIGLVLWCRDGKTSAWWATLAFLETVVAATRLRPGAFLSAFDRLVLESAWWWFTLTASIIFWCRWMILGICAGLYGAYLLSLLRPPRVAYASMRNHRRVCADFYIKFNPVADKESATIVQNDTDYVLFDASVQQTGYTHSAMLDAICNVQKIANASENIWLDFCKMSPYSVDVAASADQLRKSLEQTNPDTFSGLKARLVRDSGAAPVHAAHRNGQQQPPTPNVDAAGNVIDPEVAPRMWLMSLIHLVRHEKFAGLAAAGKVRMSRKTVFWGLVNHFDMVFSTNFIDRFYPCDDVTASMYEYAHMLIASYDGPKPEIWLGRELRARLGKLVSGVDYEVLCQAIAEATARAVVPHF